MRGCFTLPPSSFFFNYALLVLHVSSTCLIGTPGYLSICLQYICGSHNLFLIHVTTMLGNFWIKVGILLVDRLELLKITLWVVFVSYNSRSLKKWSKSDRNNVRFLPVTVTYIYIYICGVSSMELRVLKHHLTC